MRILFSLAFILFSLHAQTEQLKVDVSASSSILINADTGKILFEKQPHLRLYPASTTKIATALYALEKKGGLSDEMIVALADCVGVVHASIRQAANTKQPSYRLEHDGTHMWIKVGESLSFRTLMYGLMLQSGNDAANVIAHHISGSVPKFIDELNAFVNSLGLTETHFNNPHGLFHRDHYTTASDMAKLTQVALKNRAFREIIKAPGYPRHKTNKQEEGTLNQKNRLVKPGKYYYPKAIGVKIGYTSGARNAFVAAAEHEGRTLIAVFFDGPKMDFNFQDAIKLFEAAFSQEPTRRTLFATGYDQFSSSVDGKPLTAALASDVVIEYYPAEEPICTPRVQWHPLSLPIHKGDLVAHLDILADEAVISRTPLYATVTLNKSLSASILECVRAPYFKGAILFLAVALLLLFFLLRKKPTN